MVNKISGLLHKWRCIHCGVTAAYPHIHCSVAAWYAYTRPGAFKKMCFTNWLRRQSRRIYCALAEDGWVIPEDITKRKWVVVRGRRGYFVGMSPTNFWCVICFQERVPSQFGGSDVVHNTYEQVPPYDITSVATNAKDFWK
jgi:hypothetical protein